jgi:tRNA 2-thiouridine synthesizing protein B
MSSSPSERRVLHMVVRPPWAGDALARALAHARPGDVVLLAQDAAALACAPVALDPPLAIALGAASVRVLATDLAARGLDRAPLRAGVAAIDDAAWVALAADCDACVTWA